MSPIGWVVLDTHALCDASRMSAACSLRHQERYNQRVTPVSHGEKPASRASHGAPINIPAATQNHGHRLTTAGLQAYGRQRAKRGCQQTALAIRAQKCGCAGPRACGHTGGRCRVRSRCWLRREGRRVVGRRRAGVGAMGSPMLYYMVIAETAGGRWHAPPHGAHQRFHPLHSSRASTKTPVSRPRRDAARHGSFLALVDPAIPRPDGAGSVTKGMQP